MLITEYKSFTSASAARDYWLQLTMKSIQFIIYNLCQMHIKNYLFNMKAYGFKNLINFRHKDPIMICMLYPKVNLNP